jgi:tRNA 2-thiouridine synthesizing protein E
MNKIDHQKTACPGGEYMNSHIKRDPEGYLLNPEDWTENIASELAIEEGIDLTDEHWSALKFIRSYHDEHGITPDVRHLLKQMAAEHGSDKTHTKKFLFKLFPYGYVKQACKISGMQRPRTWSTG